MINRWVLKKPDENTVKELMTKGGVTSLAAKALNVIGINSFDEALRFFGQDSGTRYSDPEVIPGMNEAAEIIAGAVDEGKKICIYGDYDCDGITASAVLADYLGSIGADVSVHINERDEGYGMNCDAIRRLSEQGVQLIVTVDNGIACIDEAKLCRELGMELVITDHHQAGDELPECAALVDAHIDPSAVPFEDFCGCAVALKLIAAMEQADTEFAVEQYGDLAAIATVADVVPLCGENRHIVSDGIRVLENTERPGLKALVEGAGVKKLDSISIAFGIAPKINAAGRIASPRHALDLLMCEDEEKAAELVDKVFALNSRRQTLTDQIYTDISRQVSAAPSLLDRRALVFVGDDWHHGVIGIAASRMVEVLDKPVFIITRDEKGLRGSARAFGEFNVFDSLMFAKEYTVKCGGHAGAGGFSLREDQLEGFRNALEEYAKTLSVRPVTEINTICGVQPSEITAENVEGLNILEPFGEGNPQPVFLLTDCTITSIVPMSGGAHTRLTLDYGGTKLDSPLFGVKTDSFRYKIGDRLNIASGLEINEFNGRRSVRLRIKGMRPKGINQEKLIAAEDYYGRFRRDEPLDKAIIAGMCPSREELGAIYTAIDGTSPIDVFTRVRSDTLNFCKVLAAFDIFDEAGLISYDRLSGIARKNQVTAKADLNKTPTLSRLTKQ